MKAHPSGVAGNRKDENDADRETPQLKIKKIEKKVEQNFGSSKICCNFAQFFGASETKQPERAH